MDENNISDQEFALFQRLIYGIAGINLPPIKKTLVVGRLAKRLKHYDLHSFAAYYHLVTGGEHPEELQTMVDLLTTNETYFFREPKHFEFLRRVILPQARQQNRFRIWSAASSSGEEAYSIAMTLAAELPRPPWEVVGSDISTKVLDKARRGHYPLERHEGIPQDYLRRYCLKGVRSQEGTFLVAPEIRDRVSFRQVNLTKKPPADLGEFDVIFLRNVLIYFDNNTKRQVVENLLPHLKRTGYFFIGHSETLTGIVPSLHAVQPTVYQRA